MASKYQAPRGTFDVLPADARVRRRIEATAAAIFARAGYEPIATPAFEDTELFERGVGALDRHRAQGDVHLRGQGRAQHHPAPRGDGADLPRLPRARHAQAGAAGEALLRRAVLPPRAPAGRPLPPVPPDRRRGDRQPTRRWPTPRRSRCSPTCSRSWGSRASSCGSAASARSDARRAYLEELKAHLRAHEAELSEDVRERIEINPLRAFDADDEGTRGVMASAPTIVERLEGEDAEHFAEVARPARRRRDRVHDRPDPRARPRLLHADDLLLRLRRARRPVRDRRRRPLRRPDRAAGRARRRPAVGWAAGIERILLALGERRGRRRPRRLHLRRRRRPVSGSAMALASELRQRRPRGGGRPRRPGPQGPAQARRPDRRPASC